MLHLLGVPLQLREPAIPLKAAAGAFGDPQHIEDDDWQWVTVDTRRRLRLGMFVAQVVSGFKIGLWHGRGCKETSQNVLLFA